MSGIPAGVYRGHATLQSVAVIVPRDPPAWFARGIERGGDRADAGDERVMFKPAGMQDAEVADFFRRHQRREFVSVGRVWYEETFLAGMQRVECADALAPGAYLPAYWDMRTLVVGDDDEAARAREYISVAK